MKNRVLKVTLNSFKGLLCKNCGMSKNLRHDAKILFFSVLFLALFLTGCTKKSAEPAKQAAVKASGKSQYTIGFSIDTLAIERWRRDCDVFMNTAKEKNANVIVQNAGNSIEEQIRQIQYLIDKKVDVIVIVAKKADSLTDVIKSARSHGIPVISYDRLIMNSDISLYVTVDSEKVGELMAAGLLKIDPNGKWFCIYGPQEDNNMAMIRSGVEKVIAGTSVNVDYVYYTDGWNYDLSYQEMSRLLKEGNIPTSVVCGNDAVANSVIQAVSEICPDKKINIVGQDADILNCQHIVSGRQTFTVYKPITELARISARIACELAAGKSVQELPDITSTIDNGYAQIPSAMLDPVAVDKENMDSVVIESGFHTYGEVYRN